VSDQVVQLHGTLPWTGVLGLGAQVYL